MRYMQTGMGGNISHELQTTQSLMRAERLASSRAYAAKRLCLLHQAG